MKKLKDGDKVKVYFVFDKIHIGSSLFGIIRENEHTRDNPEVVLVEDIDGDERCYFHRKQVRKLIKKNSCLCDGKGFYEWEDEISQNKIYCYICNPEGGKP